MVFTGHTPPEMVCVFASYPALFECLGEELRFVDLMAQAVLFPHVPSFLKRLLRVVELHPLMQACADVGYENFVFCFHFLQFLNQDFQFASEDGPIMDRQWIGVGAGRRWHRFCRI